MIYCSNFNIPRKFMVFLMAVCVLGQQPLVNFAWCDSLEPDQLITLWSASTTPDTPTNKPVYVAQAEKPTYVKPLPLYRLPSVHHSQKNQYRYARGTIANPYFTQPADALPAVDNFTKPEKSPGSDLTRYEPGEITEIVDSMSFATAPLPPSSVHKRRASPLAHSGNPEKTTNVIVETPRGNVAELDDWWSGFDSRNDEAISGSVETPKIAANPNDTFEEITLGSTDSSKVADLDPDNGPFSIDYESLIQSQPAKEQSPFVALPEPSLPNTPTADQISERVTPSIHKAYELARRGALFAARSDLINVLRQIAQANDASAETTEHTQALAEGLRALDEADDFMPVGVLLDADLNVSAIATSHRTPILHHVPSELLPHDAIARYHAFAEQRIGNSTGNLAVGSLALFGLGKIYGREAQHDIKDIQSLRKSMTIYQAALISDSSNHLAANELGVLLARNGHHERAMDYFHHVLALAPSSTVYKNMANVQRKLGDLQGASINEQQSLQFARLERSQGVVSRSLGISWVSPQEMIRVGNTPRQPPVEHPRSAENMPPQTPDVHMSARNASVSNTPSFSPPQLIGQDKSSQVLSGQEPSPAKKRFIAFTDRILRR